MNTVFRAVHSKFVQSLNAIASGETAVPAAKAPEAASENDKHESSEAYVPADVLPQHHCRSVFYQPNLRARQSV
ncbi:MAG: hypothetical protein CMJ64_09410 [Planctomycetaceae bacterium]|nr:hypothetical protein [Planctomycetaceae bacterium]